MYWMSIYYPGNTDGSRWHGFYASQISSTGGFIGDCVGISNYFRGRTTIFELVNQPFGHIATLRYIIDREVRDKRAQEAKKGEVLEDAVNGDL